MKTAGFLQDARIQPELWENSMRLPTGLSFHAPDGHLYHVPDTFWSNGASIPWWARWACGHNLDRKNRRAGHLHDYLVCPRKDGTLPISRERAAEVFRQALAADGKSLPGRWVMWLAVYVDALWRRGAMRLTGSRQ